VKCSERTTGVRHLLPARHETKRTCVPHHFAGEAAGGAPARRLRAVMPRVGLVPGGDWARAALGGATHRHANLCASTTLRRGAPDQGASHMQVLLTKPRMLRKEKRTHVRFVKEPDHHSVPAEALGRAREDHSRDGKEKRARARPSVSRQGGCRTRERENRGITTEDRNH
jgi:hypothetical protein